jgi:hypothetical protein
MGNMKTRLLILIGTIVFSSFGFTEIVSGLCAAPSEDSDWPDRPCLDMSVNGCYDAELVGRWSVYYQMKGNDWMDVKKVEMLDALQKNELSEWESKSEENYNVWAYYHYHEGIVPDFEGKYYDCFGFSIPGNPFWFIPYSSWFVLLITISVLSIIGVKFWRKRK